MNQLKILFTPMNSFGHLNGCYGLAERLLDHNCKVIFIVIGEPLSKPKGDLAKRIDMIVLPDDRKLEKKIIVDNVEKTVALTKREFMQEMVITMVDTVGKMSLGNAFVYMMQFIHKVSAEQSREFNPKFEKLLEEIKPDFIIIDQFMPPTVLIDGKRPWATFYSPNPLGILLPIKDGVTTPLSFFGYELLTKEERIKLYNENRQEYDEKFTNKWLKDRETFRQAFRPETSGWNAYIKELGPQFSHLEVKEGQIAIKSPFINIYMYPKAIDYDKDDDLFKYDKSWLNCETGILPNAAYTHDEDWAKKIAEFRAKPGNENKPLVYFSLGSLASGHHLMMVKFIEYLASDTKRLYVVSKGFNGDKYELSDNMIGDNLVPQLFVLKQCDMAILHGGNNSTTECFYFGKPLIVIPVFGDQPDNAQRIEDLGYGYRLNAFTCTKEDILDRIDRILSDSKLRQRMKEVGDDMRKRHECDNVAKNIVDYIIKLKA